MYFGIKAASEKINIIPAKGCELDVKE
jgi:hypothetical protein